MNKLFIVLLIGLSYNGFSQTSTPYTSSSRSFINPDLQPFYHGVASGDPLADRVIIWTRITPENENTMNVNWTMATDTGFTNIVTSGTATTDTSHDFSVSVDVTGLQPNAWYYYQFEYAGKKSLIGRTRTLPFGDVDSLRFGVVSCADYESGYYNAYRHLADRNDLDAIIHLGDYIYEYGTTGQNSTIPGRIENPDHEIINLTDYRTRYSHYHLDKDLMWLRQNYPFFITWDDHEVTNNAWVAGAENHTDSTEGSYIERRAAAFKAHSEWLPIRLPVTGQYDKIFRNFKWGNLMMLHMIDTRHFARSEQVGATSPLINDSTRTLLGEEQFQWFVNGMYDANTTWQVVGNQVMMGPLRAFGTPVNADQWDGYGYERNRLFYSLLNMDIQNFVVLTGDIHTAWSMDLPSPNGDYQANTGQGSVGVEFVCTSVTSGSSPIPIPGGLISTINPHIKYVELAKKGYFVLDVNKTRTQCDHVLLSTVTDTIFTAEVSDSRYTNAGERWLRQASSPALGNSSGIQPPPPWKPTQGTGIGKNPSPVFFGAFPNPFNEQLIMQYFLPAAGQVAFSISDINGKQLFSEIKQVSTSGLQYWEVNTANLSRGGYLINLKFGGKSFNRKVTKL